MTRDRRREIIVMRAPLLLCLFSAISFSAPAVAQTPPDAVKPIFNKGRSDRYFGGVGPFYPERAAQHGVGGGALLSCVRGKADALKACRLLDETPKGENFGDAALLMAAKGWMKAPPATAGLGIDAPMLVQVPFTPSRR
jgi:hypothetical protein